MVFCGASSIHFIGYMTRCPPTFLDFSPKILPTNCPPSSHQASAANNQCINNFLKPVASLVSSFFKLAHGKDKLVLVSSVPAFCCHLKVLSHLALILPPCFLQEQQIPSRLLILDNHRPNIRIVYRLLLKHRPSIEIAAPKPQKPIPQKRQNNHFSCLSALHFPRCKGHGMVPHPIS